MRIDLYYGGIQEYKEDWNRIYMTVMSEIDKTPRASPDAISNMTVA